MPQALFLFVINAAWRLRMTQFGPSGKIYYWVYLLPFMPVAGKNNYLAKLRCAENGRLTWRFIFISNNIQILTAPTVFWANIPCGCLGTLGHECRATSRTLGRA